MNGKLGRAAFATLRQELAQAQPQLSPPEPTSEQLRRERKSVRIDTSSRYEQQ